MVKSAHSSKFQPGSGDPITMKIILMIDALINFVLGVLLLLFSPGIVAWLGVPPSSTNFYPNILGAIFIGITIALIIGATGEQSQRARGLGLLGAISINLCGGTVLALWLTSGGLDLPLKGLIILWSLVAVLIIVSTVELLHFARVQKSVPPNDVTNGASRDESLGFKGQKTIMKDKEELLANLRAVFGDWEDLLAHKSESEINAESRADGWSIKDVIAHLMAWQQISIARLRAAELGAEPEYPAWLEGADPFYAEDHTTQFNARIRQIYHDQPWSIVGAAWSEGFAQFIELGDALPDDLLFDAHRYPWLRGYALSAVLEGSFEHHREHLEEISAKPE
jgi:hypothetical protein